MLDEAESLPDDVAALKAMVLTSRAELAARDAELRNRDLLIEKLKHQLAGLRRQRFGVGSEALDQFELGLEDEEIGRAAEALPAPLPGAKRQPKRRPLPEHLPREETVLTPGERCTDCGGSLKRLGEDVTEELEYIPGRFVVKRIVRPRLACRGCERFHQAPLPVRPIERGRPGPGLLAHVLVSKYCDHLPLYRQSRIFAREGIDLDRSTLAGWVGKATALLEPLADAVGRHVLEGKALFADDTPDQSARAGDRQDGDGTDLGLCAGRAALERRSAAGGVVPLLGRPQGRTSKGASGGLRRLDAQRRLCRVRQARPRRTGPRGRLPGACAAQVLRCPCRPGLGDRRRGARKDRRALRRRKGSPRAAARPARCNPWGQGRAAPRRT